MLPVALNATLERQTGLAGFDFGRADERAAMGHLLYLIAEWSRPSTADRPDDLGAGHLPGRQ